MRGNALVFGLASFMALAVSVRAASGQMAHGGHGPDQGTVHGSMMATDQMMRNVDSTMANAGSMMRELTAMHAGLDGNSQHDQMVSSMQGMLDQMRQVHGSLSGMMRDPAFGRDAAAMKSFQQAGRNLEQMVSAFQKMTKNMTKVMNEMARGPK